MAFCGGDFGLTVMRGIKRVYLVLTIVIFVFFQFCEEAQKPGIPIFYPFW
jgi:hypothetical protein